MSITHSEPGTSPGDLRGPADSMIAEISAVNDLDDTEAARLLRWCEARFHLVDAGETAVGHLIVNVSHAHRARPSAMAILDHARTEAERRQVRIYLVSAAAIMATSSLQTRRLLERWQTFPTLDAARAALAHRTGAGAERSTTRRAVDPDAST